MSDISKSNMHESTLPPIAQQTNSRIKEQPGGKLQQRSKSFFIIKTNKKKWRGRKARVKEGKNVSFLFYSFIHIESFFLLLCLLTFFFKELDLPFLSLLLSLLFLPPPALLLSPSTPQERKCYSEPKP